MFYGLLLLSICAGLAACVRAFVGYRRDRWILVAILVGSWMNYHYNSVLWGTAKEAIWFTLLGLAPIAIGGVSLVRWFQLKA